MPGENKEFMRAMQELRRSSTTTPIPSGKRYTRKSNQDHIDEWEDEGGSLEFGNDPCEECGQYCMSSSECVEYQEHQEHNETDTPDTSDTSM